MNVWIILAAMAIALAVAALINGRKKGQLEAQEDPCETCCRWEECNGVDKDSCPRRRP